MVFEFVQSAIAFWMDRERPWPLLDLPLQRMALRWLLYYVLMMSLLTALKGIRLGWGKLDRTGTVLAPSPAVAGSGQDAGGE
jgi:hypothetical protein